MVSAAATLAQRLAQNVEAVCRYYLSNGRRHGGYWQVGDVRNTPGRSLFVRLRGPQSGPGAAGHWADTASTEHGDLLDLIRLNRGLITLRDVLDEARAFLNLPHPDPLPGPSAPERTPGDRTEAARRLFARSGPLLGSLGQTYLCSRGITRLLPSDPLRVHPRCYYRADTDAPLLSFPALIAAVTDLDGRLRAVHRTWLDPAGQAKAPVETPRRAMGEVLGHAIRFGACQDVLAVGEGIETMLSLRDALPALPMVAAISARHLAALLFPAGLRLLYIARDADPAGDHAAAKLTARSREAGFEAVVLSPRFGDFNDDLAALGVTGLRAHLLSQLRPEHRAWASNPSGGGRDGVRDGFAPSVRLAGDHPEGESHAERTAF